MSPSQTMSALALFLVISINQGLHSLPTEPEKWKNPFGTQQEIIFNIKSNIKKGMDLADQTKLRYANERIQNAELIRMLETGNTQFLEFPNSTITSNIPGYNVSWWHLAAYKHLAISAVFLEQVRINETIRQNSGDGSFIVNINDTESTIYEILRDLQKSLIPYRVFVENYPSREIMSNELRYESDSLSTNIRDFIIMKEISKMCKIFLNVYETIGGL